MDIPVIVTMESDCQRTALRFLQEGACFCLQKPLNIKELRNMWQYVALNKLTKDRKTRLRIRDDRIAADQHMVDLSEPHLEELQDNTVGKNIANKKEYSDVICLDMEDGLNLNKKRKTVISQDNGESSCKRGKKDDIWTPVLELKFLNALDKLGGDGTPTKIQELMKVEGLEKKAISSHLKWHRTKKRREGEHLHLLLPKGKQQLHPSEPSCVNFRTSAAACYNNSSMEFLPGNEHWVNIPVEGSSQIMPERLNNVSAPAAKTSNRLYSPVDFTRGKSIPTQIQGAKEEHKSSEHIFHSHVSNFSPDIGFNTGSGMSNATAAASSQFPMWHRTKKRWEGEHLHLLLPKGKQQLHPSEPSCVDFRTSAVARDNNSSMEFLPGNEHWVNIPVEDFTRGKSILTQIQGAKEEHKSSEHIFHGHVSNFSPDIGFNTGSGMSNATAAANSQFPMWHSAKRGNKEQLGLFLSEGTQPLYPWNSKSSCHIIRCVADPFDVKPSMDFLHANEHRVNILAEGSFKTMHEQSNNIAIPAAENSSHLYSARDFTKGKSKASELIFHGQVPNFSSDIGFNTGSKMLNASTPTSSEFHMVTNHGSNNIPRGVSASRFLVPWNASMTTNSPSNAAPELANVSAALSSRSPLGMSDGATKKQHGCSGNLASSSLNVPGECSSAFPGAAETPALSAMPDALHDNDLDPLQFDVDADELHSLLRAFEDI